MTDPSREFYARWAPVYDRVARDTPGVRRWRLRSVEALSLESGDCVLDVGVGTGANVSFLRSAVGPGGHVVGVDATRRMLERATSVEDWPNVAYVEGDGARLPVCGDFDGVLGTFVVGLFEDPGRVVADWFDVVKPGGRVALLDAKPSETAHAVVVNPFFRLFVWASTPRESRYRPDVDRVLEARVSAARDALVDHGVVVVDEEFAFGLVRVTAAERDD